jgi:hypothetical protein
MLGLKISKNVPSTKAAIAEEGIQLKFAEIILIAT